MARLLNLPRDLLTHLLLHHFTVQEVIQLRCLCQELYDLVHYCLGRRRSLKLFFSFAEVKAYTQLLFDHNLESDAALRLHHPGPSSDELILDQHLFLNPVVDLLVDRLFPNVTYLIIFFGYDIFKKKSLDDEIRFSNLIQDNVTYLITKTRCRLTGLSLFGINRGDEIGRRTSRRLLHSINKLDNLRRLDLCVKYFDLCTNNKHYAYLDGDEIIQPEPKHPFLVLEPKLLNKLERVSILFDNEGYGQDFCEHSFQHLGQHLTQLVMYQLYAGKYYYVPEPQLCRSLIGRTSFLSTSSITHLKLTQHLSTLLPKVLPRFAGLKSLDLVNSTFSKTESGMSLLELFGTLAQFCTKLTDLKLSKFSLGWVREAEQYDLLQLVHITNLVLKCVRLKDHYGQAVKTENENIPFSIFFRTFAFIMPNLKRFHLKTEPSYFRFSDGDTLMSLGIMPKLRMFLIGRYYGVQFTCHQLLSVQYRKRYINECGERWTGLENYLVIYFKDLEGHWTKEKF